MNPRRWLLSHPLVIRAAAFMQAAGLTPDSICRSIDRSIIPDLPNDRERGDVIRILRRMLKHSATKATGTIETSGMEDTEHSIP
jgi:hypothetical protein